VGAGFLFLGGGGGEARVEGSGRWLIFGPGSQPEAGGLLLAGRGPEHIEQEVFQFAGLTGTGATGQRPGPEGTPVYLSTKTGKGSRLCWAFWGHAKTNGRGGFPKGGEKKDNGAGGEPARFVGRLPNSLYRGGGGGGRGTGPAFCNLEKRGGRKQV